MEHSLVVLVPDLKENHKAAIQQAAEKHGFVCHLCEDAGQSLAFLPNAEVIFGANPGLMKHAPRLRWICSHFAGIDGYLKEGVFASPEAVLSCSSGAYGVTIAEHILMVLLEILRRHPEYQDHVRQREWVRRLPMRSIYGSRVVLLGTGDIGQETCRRLRGFQPQSITGVNRRGQNPEELFDRIFPQEALDSALLEADILIISLPGTPETRHMISTPQLRLLPEDAIIINVGRGSVLDQSALEAELRRGRLYAGLDVFEVEPLPADSPLWDNPRVLVTPHIAGDTSLPHTVDKIVEQFLEDFENYTAGRPLLRKIDRARGY